jgi:hypothetical protein
VDRRFFAVSLAGVALAFGTGCDRDVVLADGMDCQGTESQCFYATVIQATVQSGSAGQNADGNLAIHRGSGMGRAHLDAEVTCLHVDGNTAIIGWRGTLTGYQLGPYYKAGLERLRDLGPRDSGQDTFEGSETEELSETPVPGPTTCSSFPGLFPRTYEPTRILQGDVFVYDAPVGPDAVRGALGR